MQNPQDIFQQQKLIRHDNLLWLLVAQGVVILPLLMQLPMWLWVIWGGSLYWRWKIHAGQRQFPGSISKLAISIAAIAGLLLTYQGAFGVEAMVGFLVFTFIIKLLELRSRKDGLLIIFIGFIAVAAQFLFIQSIWATLYAAVSCMVLITAWKTIYATRELAVKHKLTSGSILLLQAIPLMLVMFVVMPRLGPLWHTPLLNQQAQTGFSETLSPGDIGSLVQSTGTAFRVTFLDDSTPRQSELYWRGLILENFDGRTWTRPRHPHFTDIAPIAKQGDVETVNYEVLMEAHRYPWLFSLANPIKANTGAVRSRITSNGLLVAREPLNTRLQYQVASVNPRDTLIHELSSQQREQLTTLPEGFNPKAVALAKTWRNTLGSPDAIIAKALAFYHQDFYYTLSPPLLGENSVDDFLFSSKQGFCEHFASSFTVLMRAADIPARVVVGYQGGRYDASENYWSIRQADAHAWTEVWLTGIGWQRVDPTSAVAPQRVEQGIDNALQAADRSRIAAGQFSAPQWLTHLRHRFDAANYLWSRWVLSYDAQQQNQLLKQLFGGKEPWRVGLIFLAIISSLMGCYITLVIRPKWQARSPLQKSLSQFDKTCQQWKLQRADHETLAQFCLRLGTKQPQLLEACQRLGALSQAALYDPKEDNQQQLMTALKRFPKE
ncbi:transglutaminaseTgpA domain-containing protein [Psychromonas sp. GE-S-Ul-11]|uniref:transglutaminase family protein n=1 Tax=unclassified Psychromonas TaxID=2614957 RepID=UPI00390C6C8C